MGPMKANDSLSRLALADAVVKACKQMTDPRGGAHGAPNLRTEADDALREAYLMEGTDRRRITINGEQVGTLSARFTKGVDGVVPEIYDCEKLIEWLRTTDGGWDTLQRLVYSMPCKVLEAATTDGELPDGCRMVERSEPPQWAGTTLRVDSQKVARALAGELPEAVAGLLDGGDES